jgi:hypothetical protein
VIGSAGHADAEAARRCLRGDLLAEELSTTARELVVVWLHGAGLADREVPATKAEVLTSSRLRRRACFASRTGMTTYTAARIRARLALPAVQP